MTVTSRKYFSDWFLANGINKDWGFDFTILSQDDVVMLVRDGTDDTTIVEHTTDIGFFPAEDFATGSVKYPVFAAALPVGKQVRILRRVAYLQLEKIGKEGKFLPLTHEKAFDKATILTQQVDNDLARAVQVIEGATPLVVVSDIPDGAVLMKNGNFIVEGPNAVSINSAQGYAEDAEAAMVKAEQWAENPEDVEVEPDAYSSKHWATKSGASAVIAGTAKDETQELRDEVEALLATGRVPLGTVIHSAIPQTANGFLLCDGAQCTPLYPDLRAALIAAGSPFGTAGGNPLLPDEVTASRFRRAANGTNPLGSVRDDQMQQITGTLEIRSTTTGGAGMAVTAAGALGRAIQTGGLASGATIGASQPLDIITFNSANSPGARTGTETRPKDIAYLPYIKAFGAITMEGMADLAALLTAIASEAEAVAGLDNTKLMTPLRTQQAVFAYNKWRMIEDVDLTSVASYIKTGLAAFEAIRLDGEIVNSVSAANGVQLSTDNGASWLTSGYMFNGGTSTETSSISPGYNGAVNSFTLHPNALTANANFPHKFWLTLGNLNKTLPKTALLLTHAVTSGSLNASTFAGLRGPTLLVANAIRIIPGAGQFSRLTMTLEGKEG